jgi:hypothetical protein
VPYVGTEPIQHDRADGRAPRPHLLDRLGHQFAYLCVSGTVILDQRHMTYLHHVIGGDGRQDILLLPNPRQRECNQVGGVRMDHAGGVRFRGIDATMQHERLAGALAAQLRTICSDLGENVRLKEAQARLGGRDQKTLCQPNTDVACRGMNVAALKERAAHTTDLLPKFHFIHRSQDEGKGFIEKVRRSKVTRF